MSKFLKFPLRCPFVSRKDIYVNLDKVQKISFSLLCVYVSTLTHKNDVDFYLKRYLLNAKTDTQQQKMSVFQFQYTQTRHTIQIMDLFIIFYLPFFVCVI